MYTVAKLTNLWAQRFKRGIHSDLQKQLLHTLLTRWGRKTSQGGWAVGECVYRDLYLLADLTGSLHSFPQCRTHSTGHFLA